MCLPHRIKETVEDREPEMGNIVFVPDVDIVSALRSLLGTGVCTRHAWIVDFWSSMVRRKTSGINTHRRGQRTRPRRFQVQTVHRSIEEGAGET
jgi:hypothetical protein